MNESSISLGVKLAYGVIMTALLCSSFLSPHRAVVGSIALMCGWCTMKIITEAIEAYKELTSRWAPLKSEKKEKNEK